MKIKIEKGLIIVNGEFMLIDNIENREWLNAIIKDAIKEKKVQLCIIK